jgi:alpha/beta superfamily hydrolase
MDTRAIRIESAGPSLEGMVHLPGEWPAPGLVVCHPHPQYGGDMHNNVVEALCETAVSNGIAALRFNFRGAGASEGRYDNGVGEQQDALAALTCLRDLPEVDSDRTGLAGYSFGAAVSLRVAGSAPALRAFVAISLPTMMPLEDVALDCPALFISGDEDEYSDVDDLTAFVATLGPRAELKLLPGLGHFWFGVERDMQGLVVPFLQRHLITVPAT